MTKLIVREWDYDDAELSFEVVGAGGHAVALGQMDGNGRMELRIFETGHARRLAEALLAWADKQDAARAQFRRASDRRMRALYGDDWPGLRVGS